MVAAQYTICLPLCLIFMRYVDTSPLLGWGAAVAAFIAYFTCYAVMIWTAETDYSS